MSFCTISVDRHEALVVVVAAFLRKGLILEMERRDPGALEGARGGLRIERIAVAGIGISDDRHSTTSTIEASRSTIALD